MLHVLLTQKPGTCRTEAEHSSVSQKLYSVQYRQIDYRTKRTKEKMEERMREIDGGGEG